MKHNATHTNTKLLLVEDDDIDARLFERTISRRQVPVELTRAKDGVEALRALEDAHPHGPALIVLDLNLPRMDGFELLDHLRGDERLQRSVVLALTTSEDARDIRRAYDRQVAGYFVKDVESGQLKGFMDFLEAFLAEVQLPSGSDGSGAA